MKKPNHSVIEQMDETFNRIIYKIALGAALVAQAILATFGVYLVICLLR